MKKMMFVFMMFSGHQIVFTSEISDECPVNQNWSDADIIRELDDPNSKLNVYLKKHEERDEFVADCRGAGLVQVVDRNNKNFKMRENLRQKKEKQD